MSAQVHERPAAEHAADPYGNGLELLNDLCQVLDERLIALVDKFPLLQQRVDDLNLRGLVITDAEARRLLERDPRSAHPGYAVGSLWQAVEARIAASHSKGITLPLDLVRERFRLSDFETECMAVCVAAELQTKYQKLYSYLNDDVTQKYPSVDLLLRLLTPADNAPQYRGFLAPSSRLLRGELLAWTDENASGPPLNRCLKVDPAVQQFLFQDYKLDSELELVWLERESPPEAEILWAANNSAVTSIKPHISAYLAQDGTKHDRLVIALTGRAGSGRRNAMELACWQSGLGMIALDCARLIKHPRFEQVLSRAFRDSLLHAAPLVLGNFEAVVQNPERGPEFRIALERLMEEWGWILVVLREEPDSGNSWFPRHRRLEVAIPELTDEARKDLWALLLSDRTELEQPAIEEISGALATKFRLSPGQIAVAFRRCAHVLDSERSSVEQWRSLLHAEAAKLSAPHLGALARKIKPIYRWSQLVLPERKMDLVKDVVRHMQQRRRVMEQWEFETLMSRGKGLTVLFSGLPGTGKTMAAEVIANELQMDLYRIDLAGVVSKFIGETEKNLSRIFREAEYSDAILFFDEADALFGKRSEVKDAHDRYANIEINYLLQQIENFEGVVVLATNMRQHLDEAFLRRMQVVVEFPVPSYEDRLRIWRQSFPPQAPLGSDVDFDFLARQFELVGGHIANISLWSAVLASEEDSDISMLHCLRATRRELEKIGRHCMKEEFGPYSSLLEPALEAKPC